MSGELVIGGGGSVAVATDGRLYLTEDKPDGALYRFTPTVSQSLDDGLLEPRVAELPTERYRYFGGRATRADSTSERWVLRDSHLHRGGAARTPGRLDQRLDVVSSALESTLAGWRSA